MNKALFSNIFYIKKRNKIIFMPAHTLGYRNNCKECLTKKKSFVFLSSRICQFYFDKVSM